MAKKQNFGGDIDLIWLQKGTRQRTYREILQEAQKADSPLATKEQIMQQATDLTELIKAASDASEESIGALEHTMQENYVATTTLGPEVAPIFGLTAITVQEQGEDVTKYVDVEGTVYESITTKILADAESIVENFSSIQSTNLDTVSDDIRSEIYSAVNLFDGQIRRGFITVDGITYFGIVISSRSVFTVETKVGADNAPEYSNNSTYEVGDFVYNGTNVYECKTRIRTPEEWTSSHWTKVGFRPSGDTHCYFSIDTGDCFGLYTATGWQFWHGREKLGWFDSGDGMLHVESISIDDHFQMGNWKFVNNGTAFGIKYIG